MALHCPKLGHTIPFSYCMRARMDDVGRVKPCIKIMDCWWETFDIASFLKDNLSESDFEELVHKKPASRAAGLFDAIEKALAHKNDKH